VSGTTTISTTKLAVTNGSITVPVEVASAFYAYRIHLTGSVTGVEREAAAAASKSDAYRVVDLQGRDFGIVGTKAGESIERSVARIAPRPGVYMLMPGIATGAARKVVVPAP
jgi:hypothetical protein